MANLEAENAELIHKNNQLEVAVGDLLKEVRFLKNIANEQKAQLQRHHQPSTIQEVVSAAAIQGTWRNSPGKMFWAKEWCFQPDTIPDRFVTQSTEGEMAFTPQEFVPHAGSSAAK